MCQLLSLVFKAVSSLSPKHICSACIKRLCQLQFIWSHNELGVNISLFQTSWCFELMMMTLNFEKLRFCSMYVWCMSIKVQHLVIHSCITCLVFTHDLAWCVLYHGFYWYLFTMWDQLTHVSAILNCCSCYWLLVLQMTVYFLNICNIQLHMSHPQFSCS